MTRDTWTRIIRYGARMGLVAGCTEMVAVSMHTALDLSLVQALALSIVSMAFGAAIGACAGLAAGLVLFWPARRWWEVRILTSGVALSALFLSSVYLAHPALALLGVGKMLGAVLMALYPLGLAGLALVNARYFIQRAEAGHVTRLHPTVLFLLGTGLVSLLASVGMSQRRHGSPDALEGDPSVLMITIDTLRRDHVGIYGEGLAETPRMDALGREGAVFWNAVTPMPETAPAHATLMTSLHPLRHKLISNAHRLPGGVRTFARVLEQEGYATGAFLSSYAVDSRTGLDRGFETYDDDFMPGVKGLSELLVSRVFAKLVMATHQPQRFPWLLERDGARTNDVASAWIRKRAGRPFFAWVHYFEPHAPYEGPGATVDHRALIADPEHVYTDVESAELRRLYALEVEESDRLVGELLDLLDNLEIADDTMVVVTSDHGEQLGEHGIFFHHHGIFDESIQIPLLMRLPGEDRSGRVDAQVRLMDIVPTLLSEIHLSPWDRTEGSDLGPYLDGTREESMSCTLMGRRSPSRGSGMLFGLRTDTAKYIQDPDGEEWFYALEQDPEETRSVAESQPDALAAGRDMVARERLAFEGNEARIDEQSLERLEALGYVE